ncbi:MAG: Gfo/Idh/MocA family oxidoreductase [Boseongicola sp.]|nr:Gfo/Idh/MocA family oxidoreductase [Boseongicola sp.]
MADIPAIAVVGAGLIGQRHIDVVSRGARLAAIVDPDLNADALAARHGVERYPGLDAYLATARPDGVILATPNQMHVAQGLQCVRAGVPVLIEKPIANDVASASALVDESEAAGVPILVGHHRRHNPLVRAAKAVIEAGRLGDIVAATAEFWLYKPDDYFAPDWRRAPGAGPVFINLIHDIDLMRHFCGNVEYVQAMESRAVRGFEVEDTMAVLLRFANGALATVSVSDTISAPWSWEFTSGENPVYPNVTTSCYKIGGTHGALSVPDMTLWRHEGVRSWWEPIGSETIGFETADPLMRQLEDFVGVIRDGATPLVSGREGLESLRVVEAIKTAAATGETVALGAAHG